MFRPRASRLLATRAPGSRADGHAKKEHRRNLFAGRDIAAGQSTLPLRRQQPLLEPGVSGDHGVARVEPPNPWPPPLITINSLGTWFF